MQKSIGLMGCLTSNPNMGCLALTYSMIQLLENLFPERNTIYYIFDNEYVEDAINRMCKELEVERDRINIITIGHVSSHTAKDKLKCLYYCKKNIYMIKMIKKCDYVIDITQGDSFTDIYGKDRFFVYSAIKKLVQKCRIPLILGPQTYGPFENEKMKKYAKKIIEKSYRIISRDQKSKDYVESFWDKDV